MHACVGLAENTSIVMVNLIYKGEKNVISD